MLQTKEEKSGEHPESLEAPIVGRAVEVLRVYLAKRPKCDEYTWLLLFEGCVQGRQTCQQRSEQVAMNSLCF